MSDPHFIAGQFLLSMPGIGDTRFERAVIAMCVHDDNGALGIVVNHPRGKMTVCDLMEQLNIAPGATPAAARVMVGGPVEPGRGFVIHSADYTSHGTILVSGLGGTRWGLTSTIDILHDISLGQGPRQWLAALGYTGWGAGQLDAELLRHGWHQLEGTDDLAFTMPIDRRWPRAFAELGIDVGHLSPVAGTA